MTFRPTQILVPTDFSEFSDRAIEAALVLASAFGAKVTVLHVVPLSEYANYAARAVPATAELENLERTLHAAAAKNLADEVAKRGSAVPITSVTLDGPAPSAICDYAREHGIDLIVVGSHGRSGLKHLLLGSVAERVVRHAPAPVLVIREAAR